MTNNKQTCSTTECVGCSQGTCEWEASWSISDTVTNFSVGSRCSLYKRNIVRDSHQVKLNITLIGQLTLGTLYLPISSTAQELQFHDNLDKLLASNPQLRYYQLSQQSTITIRASLPMKRHFAEVIAGYIAPDRSNNSDNSNNFLIKFPYSFSTLYFSTILNFLGSPAFIYAVIFLLHCAKQ